MARALAAGSSVTADPTLAAPGGLREQRLLVLSSSAIHTQVQEPQRGNSETVLKQYTSGSVKNLDLYCRETHIVSAARLGKPRI